MQRAPDSHKGENGKVAVIGGSRYQHGAPLFSALAAEATGVDLIYVALPACHQTVARATSLNFQVHPFHGDDLSEQDRLMILELLATIDVAVIGPGIARTDESLRVTLDILSEASCPLVVDASALQPTTIKRLAGKTAVLTPHLGELDRMRLLPSELPKPTKGSNLVILQKGPVDHVIADGLVENIEGGNAGLTVGGTGDALAGVVAGLLAQRVAPREAAMTASRVIKRAGALLQAEYGHAYTTRKVIKQIPKLLTELA